MFLPTGSGVEMLRAIVSLIVSVGLAQGRQSVAKRVAGANRRPLRYEPVQRKQEVISNSNRCGHSGFQVFLMIYPELDRLLASFLNSCHK